MLSRARRLSSLSTTVPGRLGDVGVDHHLVLRPRVVLPAADRLEIHRRQLPLAHRVLEPGLEARLLLGIAARRTSTCAACTPSSTSIRSKIGHWCRNRWYSSAVQKPMTRSTPARLYHERSKQHDLAGRGQLGDVALEVPLPALALRRRRERDDAGDAWVEVLRHALDRAALAGRVAPSKTTTRRFPRPLPTPGP